MTKSLSVFRFALADRLAYRAHFMAGSLIRFLPLLTVIYLWGAVYGASEQSQLGGLAFEDVVFYYVLAMITRSFASMPGLAMGIASEIREGTLSRYLVKPLGIMAYQFYLRLAHKLIFISSAALPYACLLYFLRDYIGEAPTGESLAGGLLSLVMAFFIGFLVHFLMGALSFWFLEVSTFLFILMMIEYFCSGHMIPLDFLPDGIQGVVKALPFKFTAYVPAMILLGKITGAHLVWTLVQQFVWLLGLAGLTRWVLRAGLRRYSAFGG